MFGETTVKDLIEELKKYPKDAKVKVGVDNAIGELNDIELWDDGETKPFLALTYNTLK